LQIIFSFANLEVSDIIFLLFLFEESLNISSQIWMTGTNEAAFKKLENSSKLQYFVINDIERI